jgi:DNA-binding CsgD family transcriptional regulator
VLQTDTPAASLFVMHEDILLTGQREHDALTQGENEIDLVPPTRTMSESQYHLVGDVCVIGRDPLCDIRISSHRIDISRQHATLKREGTRFVLHDHSRYGSYVNGQPISAPCQLDTGDIIGFANSREMLRFVDFTTGSQETPLLTERERGVLHLVAAGKLNKEIAVELQIAPNTVNTHLKNIYEKLSAHNRTEAVNQARKLRLLDS